jgi:hypothetical protein
MHQLAWRILLVIDVEVLEQALDRRQLVRRIENLELRGQAGLAVVSAQEAVAKAVKGPDPHAAGIDRQHAARRACISLAALLVKVTARMPCGPTWPVEISQAMRVVSTRVLPNRRRPGSGRAAAAG